MKLYLILFFIFLNVLTSSAHPPIQSANSAPLSFVENKGQATDQYGKSRTDLQYILHSKGLSVFIGKGAIHYQFCKLLSSPRIFNKKDIAAISGTVIDTTPSTWEMYRLDMSLLGADTNALVIPEEMQVYSEHYHTAAFANGDATASSYNKITYKNIYPNIDWVLYMKKGKLEYDFVVRPGGNINDIQIKYSGADKIAPENGEIKISTPLGSVYERQLYAYDVATGKQVAATFKQTADIIGFTAPATNNKSTIAIDPELAWGTYFGGVGRDGVQGSCCDKSGNVFICGVTSSVTNLATTGSYNTLYSGQSDAMLAKFNSYGNSLGNLLWWLGARLRCICSM